MSSPPSPPPTEDPLKTGVNVSGLADRMASTYKENPYLPEYQESDQDKDQATAAMAGISLEGDANVDLTKIFDQLIKKTEDKGNPSTNVPPLKLFLACANPAHKPTIDMEKGVFTIYGPDIDCLSVNALISKYNEEFVGSDQHLGCGYEGCDVNLDESLERASRGMIQCFRCTPGDEPVNIEESCAKHEDTTPVLLVLQALREVASWYKKQARTVQLKGTPLIFTNELGGEIYPLTTNDALLLHPAIKAKKKS